MIDSTLKNANILVVDDQESNVDVLIDFLNIQGYSNVKTTTDPRDVVPLMDSFKPDLVLLDLQMPFLSGYQVMEQIKGLSAENTLLPILVLTADITAEAKKKALSGGATDFLSKPFNLVEVSLRIKNLLYTKYLLQLLQGQNQILEDKVRERTLELEQTNAGLLEVNIKLEASERNLRDLNIELEQRVKERTVELETSNRELEAFSYSVSHDLRAPLRHIHSFIEVMTEIPVNRTEEELYCMKTIADGAREMSDLIEALLNFSRLSHAELQTTTIQMRPMVEQVVNLFEPEIIARNISFRIGTVPDCRGDEQLLRQVWINLVSNAVKYTGKQPEPVIGIGSLCRDNEIVFYVKDNGAGFDMKYVDKLFGVFQRLHRQSEFEGMGIGLANVRSIVNRHGGTCSAESEPGIGATFYFSIPV